MADVKMKKGERTREFFLECAADVIATEGVHRANLARIAKKAKTVPSHIAHYFPEKNRLFFLVIAHIFTKLESGVHAVPQDRGPIERLFDSIRENYAYFDRNPTHYSVVVLGYYYAGVYPELKEYLGEIYRLNIASVTKTLREVDIMAKTGKSDEEIRLLAESISYDLEGGLIFYHFSAHDLTPSRFIEHHIAAQKLKLRNAFGLEF